MAPKTTTQNKASRGVKPNYDGLYNLQKVKEQWYPHNPEIEFANRQTPRKTIKRLLADKLETFIKKGTVGDLPKRYDKWERREIFKCCMDCPVKFMYLRSGDLMTYRQNEECPLIGGERNTCLGYIDKHQRPVDFSHRTNGKYSEKAGFTPTKQQIEMLNRGTPWPVVWRKTHPPKQYIREARK